MGKTKEREKRRIQVNLSYRRGYGDGVSAAESVVEDYLDEKGIEVDEDFYMRLRLLLPRRSIITGADRMCRFL